MVQSARDELHDIARTRLCSVVNATGIIIHTNLGRSPLGERAVDAVGWAARDYVNLEYDLDVVGAEDAVNIRRQVLSLLCGSEAACVVNNCAVALVLILRAS